VLIFAEYTDTSHNFFQANALEMTTKFTTTTKRHSMMICDINDTEKNTHCSGMQQNWKYSYGYAN